MAAGGITIQQRVVLKTAVSDPSILEALPNPPRAMNEGLSCQNRAKFLIEVGPLHWSDDDALFMASCLSVAVQTG